MLDRKVRKEDAKCRKELADNYHFEKLWKKLCVPLQLNSFIIPFIGEDSILFKSVIAIFGPIVFIKIITAKIQFLKQSSGTFSNSVSAITPNQNNLIPK